MLDHSHHTWSNDIALAGLQASIGSGALGNFRDMATKDPFKGSPTTLGVAYDSFSNNANTGRIRNIINIAQEFNTSVITTHALEAALRHQQYTRRSRGPWRT
ncbi:hypothetical protein B0T18DRAFT_425555 [Schizothecium vesticola]|uniref:Amidohydrolase-related domain-containing protein n=1 Tax=Schizothecium vesticola TaxID=314040 RepID=A0AA40F3Y7_9PEZI|nr:hypothetical protein B0T18DRAFT_425555 [Schizothecium vesticola]